MYTGLWLCFSRSTFIETFSWRFVQEMHRWNILVTVFEPAWLLSPCLPVTMQSLGLSLELPAFNTNVCYSELQLVLFTKVCHHVVIIVINTPLSLLA